jgi:hypothetical protein
MVLRGVSATRFWMPRGTHIQLSLLGLSVQETASQEAGQVGSKDGNKRFPAPGRRPGYAMIST